MIFIEEKKAITRIYSFVTSRRYWENAWYPSVPEVGGGGISFGVDKRSTCIDFTHRTFAEKGGGGRWEHAYAYP